MVTAQSGSWRRLRRPARFAVFVAVMACGAACTSSTEDVPPLSESATTAGTTTSETRSEHDAVVEAYNRLWPRLDEAIAQPESRWPELLGEVAADPQLGRTLAAMQQLKAQGRTLYGTEKARITSVDVDGDRATLTDCQDASHAGQADAQTGDPKTVGVARNPVTATLLRGPDGVWRVSDISYPGGSC